MSESDEHTEQSTKPKLPLLLIVIANAIFVKFMSDLIHASTMPYFIALTEDSRRAIILYALLWAPSMAFVLYHTLKQADKN
jgi:hypothetical protein